MNYDETAQYLTNAIARSGHPMPTIAIVLGSGLGKLGEKIENPLVIPYRDIPHFKASTAVGHKGNLIVGTLSHSATQPLSHPKTVMAMQGRFHYYEGYTMEEVSYPMRVFARMGVRQVLVSNAAGAVNPDFRVGDLMVITDHINFMPNPLVGPNKEDFGPRFPDMTEVYSHRIRTIAHEESKRLGLSLREGVYVAGTGPTYETPAEYRMYRIWGADACGMSTVPEVIVARHSGMEVFGMSVITNQSNDLGNGVVNDGDDVVRAADRAADNMTALFTSIINRL